MGFFREDRFGGFSGLSYLSNLEKLHTVFMDVETEGRARGYELAAEKYKEAFSRIQKEYNELKKNIDEQIQNTDIAAQTLILKLKDLEDKKASLEHTIRYKKNLPINAEIETELKECADSSREWDSKMEHLLHILT